MPASSPSKPASADPSLLKRPLGWIVLVACALILCSRRPDAISNPQFWAEDGYFFRMNLEDGLEAFLVPYAGYLHFIPRLIAALSGLLDFAWIPTAYVYACLALTVYVAGMTLSNRFPLRPAIGCALAVALVPDMPDGLFTPTNLQSILAGGFLALLLFRDPRTPLEYGHDLFAAFAFGLTGPFSVILTPLFVVRAYIRRTAPSVALACIVILCGSVQLWLIKTHPLVPSAEHAPTEWAFFLAVPGSSILASLLWIRYPAPENVVWLLNLMGVFAIVGIVGLGWKKKELQVERYFLVFAIFALLASALFRSWEHLLYLARIGYGSRYFYAPQLAVLWLLLQAQHDGDRLRWCYRGLLVWFLIMNVPRLREPPQVDKHWADYVGSLRRGRAVTIPINPEGWTIPVTKRRAH